MTIDLRPQFVAIVRDLVGTPYVRHGRTRWGLDCGGAPILALREMGFDPADVLNYPETGRGGSLRLAVEANCRRIVASEAGPGDIAVLWFDRNTREPQHVVTLVEPDRIVHAYQGSGRVVETALCRAWRRRVDSWWRFRALEGGD